MKTLEQVLEYATEQRAIEVEENEKNGILCTNIEYRIEKGIIFDNCDNVCYDPSNEMASDNKLWIFANELK